MVRISEVNAKDQLDNALEMYKRDGILVVRDLIKPSLLKQVALDITRLMDIIRSGSPRMHDWSLARLICEASKRLLDLEGAKPGSQKKIYDAISNVVSMGRLATDPKLSGFVQSLLGTELIQIHPRLVCLMSMPQEEWHLAGWHQDWYYNRGPQSTVTVYAPFQRTNASNGGLIFARCLDPTETNFLLPHHDSPTGRSKCEVGQFCETGSWER